MPRLGNIQKETIKDVELFFDGEPDPLKLTIVSSKFTIGWQTRSHQFADANDVAGMADHFFSVVKDWDLEDDDGKKIPLDASGYGSLTVDTFVAIMTKMTEQLVPNDQATSN